jgi:transcriptional regulator with XRE-family HTH domain
MALTSVRARPVELNEPLLLALARARAKGRSAYKIAAAADVHPSDLSRWMHGRRTPSPAQAERLAQALGLPVEGLFPANDSRPVDETGREQSSAEQGRTATTAARQGDDEHPV